MGLVDVALRKLKTVAAVGEDVEFVTVPALSSPLLSVGITLAGTCSSVSAKPKVGGGVPVLCNAK